MAISIRQATADDGEVLLHFRRQASLERQRLNPQLWSPGSGGAERERLGLEQDFQNSKWVFWLIAEAAGRAVGAVRLLVTPAPPVYDLAGGLAGIITEELYSLPDAPANTEGKLIDTAAHFAREHGAVVVVAACPVNDAENMNRLTGLDFAPVSVWLLKTGLQGSGVAGVRCAQASDLPEIVRLNAQAQALKCACEPRFWTPHPDAEARFLSWMQKSLDLPDRDLLVRDGPAGGLSGVVVLQPGSLPPGNDASQLGFIDDFQVERWQGSLLMADRSGGAEELLAAAENASLRRGYSKILAVCPQAWTAKLDFLKAQGYMPANLWLLQR